ncbi:MAG TPA: SDR family oxidoreductase [Pseudosphingobacterium sp.]|nr:SDR family oxidoreductase [Pseudosphingobacterium sp.]
MNTILVTGASAGIGKATVRKFANQGWNVIATMRSPEKEQELTQLENVLVVRLDVEDIGSIKDAIDSGIERFGKIDVLVNNAGILVIGAFELATEEQVKKQFDVNFFGVLAVTRAILPHFRANRSGTIINISSQGGLVGFPTMSLYHASKFALEGFSEAISHELLAQNILVKLIEPGSTATNNWSSFIFAKNEAIVDYDAVGKETLDNWTKYDTDPSAPEDIANTIFLAANDKTDSLRYMVGKDTELYYGMRQKGDRAFINYMRQRFIPQIMAAREDQKTSKVLNN